MSDIRILHDFYSPPEETNRTLRIYTPDAYRSEPKRRFPTLYMLDGQNVFNHPESAIFHTWCANSTMDTLIEEGAISPWIIVAIDHLPERFAEYSPWPEPAMDADGQGWLFADFLADHLKPFIDKNYRTLPEPHWTGVMGASLGGLMSLTLGKTRPEVFGRVGAVSPTVMWANNEIFRLWDRPTGKWCKIYMDVGSLERYWYYDMYLNYVQATTNFYNHMKSIGLKDHELLFVTAQGHFHDEEAWQARLPYILPWLLEDAKGV